MTWTLGRAKDRLSELIRQAGAAGPRRISVRGEELLVAHGLTLVTRNRREVEESGCKLVWLWSG
ncbi:MAG: hypothetical protein ACREEW_00010 [Caulobacteraceae bacterium]